MILVTDLCLREHSDSGQCYGWFPMWSYKLYTNECVKFVYSGCGGNKNRFESREICEKRCKK